MLFRGILYNKRKYIKSKLILCFYLALFFPSSTQDDKNEGGIYVCIYLFINTPKKRTGRWRNAQFERFSREAGPGEGNAGLVVGHVSRGGAELGVGLDDFVHGFEEIFLRGDFPASSDGEHARLRAHAPDLRA